MVLNGSLVPSWSQRSMRCSSVSHRHGHVPSVPGPDGTADSTATVCEMSDYFDDLTVNRQRLLWTVAIRRQLERWEPPVAARVGDDLAGREFPDAEIRSGHPVPRPPLASAILSRTT